MSNTSTIQSPKTQSRAKSSSSLTGSPSKAPAASSVKSPVPTPAPTRSADLAANAHKEITFRLDANTAKEVLLAGDFTNWEKTPIKLRKGERGAWLATIKLPPGLYHYRFLVDGKWQNDPAASATAPNPFGSCNCVVKIP